MALSGSVDGSAVHAVIVGGKIIELAHGFRKLAPPIHSSIIVRAASVPPQSGG